MVKVRFDWQVQHFIEAASINPYNAQIFEVPPELWDKYLETWKQLTKLEEEITKDEHYYY